MIVYHDSQTVLTVPSVLLKTDSAEDFDALCDMSSYLTHTDATEDDQDILLESENYFCSELLGTVLY